MLSAFEILKGLVLLGHLTRLAATGTAFVVAAFQPRPALSCVPQPPLSPHVTAAPT